MKMTLTPSEQRIVIGVLLLAGFAVLLGALASSSVVLNFLQLQLGLSCTS
jgi:hypothetical protein